ncbi:hypothetical protein wCauBTS_13160 [Wolbachia pipientis]
MEWVGLPNDTYELFGREKGKIEGKIEVAKNSLKAGVSIDVIAEITGLSVDEIKQLQE